MHSRIGLITPYLSEEWKNCIEATVKHAKKIKMLAYLYDEDRWPSGFAGNKVTKIKKNRMKLLKAEKTKKKWKFKIIEAPVSEWYNNATYPDTLSYDTIFIIFILYYLKRHGLYLFKRKSIRKSCLAKPSDNVLMKLHK